MEIQEPSENHVFFVVCAKKDIQKTKKIKRHGVFLRISLPLDSTARYLSLWEISNLQTFNLNVLQSAILWENVIVIINGGFSYRKWVSPFCNGSLLWFLSNPCLAGNHAFLDIVFMFHPHLAQVTYPLQKLNSDTSTYWYQSYYWTSCSSGFYCRWKKSGHHQMRLVVYPIIYRGFSTIQTVVFSPDFWSISSTSLNCSISWLGCQARRRKITWHSPWK